MNNLQYAADTPQYRALERAVNIYGQVLSIESNRQTVTTLQGNTETGWIVYGKAHGGADLGIVFSSREVAQNTIDNITAGIPDPVDEPIGHDYHREMHEYRVQKGEIEE